MPISNTETNSIINTTKKFFHSILSKKFVILIDKLSVLQCNFLFKT